MGVLKRHQLPECLQQIASPPARLYHRGAPLQSLLQRPRVAVVGSRNVSAYGRQVTLELAGKLAEQGITIISGLALGVDAVAHRAALERSGLTIAVLPGSVERPYPAANRQLADEIIARGGALVSEYNDDAFDFKQRFIARNRLVAGLAEAVIITEAAEKSGSLHTARFALEQGKEVLAVPGLITQSSFAGTNNLLKAGASVVTSYLDVLHALKLEDHQTAAQQVQGQTAHEQRLLELLLQGVNEGTELLDRSELTTTEFNQVLTMLELRGQIRSLGANHWALV